MFPRVHDFTSHVVNPWDFTFNRQFPQEKMNYVDDGKALISDFASAVANKDIFPHASDGIDVLKEHILRTRNILGSETDNAFDDMKNAIRKAHRVAVPAVKSFLEPMYEHCGAESGESPILYPRSLTTPNFEAGRGLYARNKMYIDQFMTNKGMLMHRAGKNAIQGQLDQLLGNISAKLNHGHALILRQIRQEIKFFFEQNSSDGNRFSNRRVVSNAKVLLQQDMLVHIETLAKDWKLGVQVEEIPDNNETEDEMCFNDELFIDLSKDDDDDYSDGEKY
jgi:hypothetical protein